MKLLIVFTLFYSVSAFSYIPAWEKLCRTQIKNTSNLYEVYNDCLETCMPLSSLHRKKTLKEKVRVCTYFTARYHHQAFEKAGAPANMDGLLREGLKFCQEQKQHKTGGHWLAISRKCKRLICQYNPVVAARENKECKGIHKKLHDGKVKTEPLPDDIKQRKGKEPPP